MTKEVQLRRGTTAQIFAFTGQVGELTPDTTLKRLALHDGVTAGGKPIDAPRGWIDGLTLAPNATNPTTQIDIAPGQARDSTNATIMELTATLTKGLNAAWAAGSGNGGLFSGTVAANTWYHAFLIEKDADGSIDAGFDTSVAAANRPAGYSRYRRIGSIATDSAASISPFIQWGDVFHTPQSTAYSGGQRVMAALTLAVPPGVRVLPLLSAHVGVTSSAQGIVTLAPGDDLTLTRRFFEFNATSGNGSGAGVGPPTDTSQRIGLEVGGSGAPSVDLWVNGCIDPRGRDA